MSYPQGATNIKKMFVAKEKLTATYNLHDLLPTFFSSINTDGH